MSQLTEDQLAGMVTDIRAFLCNLVYMEEDEIDNEDPLFSTGIVDSVSLIELVGYVEKRASIKVSPGQLTLENWDSINRIRDFIARSVQG